jgi:uncharacterized membrane protein YkoI
MNWRPKYVVAGGAAAALAIVGGVAASGMGGDDEPLTGDTLARASEAALAHTGGGEVIETETEDEGNIAYSVDVRLTDGSVVEVDLDSSFQVVGDEPDDEGGDQALTGATLEQASAAALAHTGGGEVVETEAEGGGDVAYSVDVRLEDGSEVEVDLDESFQVVRSEPDGPDGDDDDDEDDDDD